MSDALSPIDEDEVEARLQEEVDALPPDAPSALVGPEFFLLVWRRMREYQAKAVTLEVVPTLADLPASAGPRRFYRVANDTTGAIYVGNGANKPLTKLLPVAV